MSTTAIELAPPSTTVRRRVASDEDEILQASREADEEAPDGGYGWVIVGAGCMLLWWCVGTTYSWGVIQRYLVEQGLAGPATLSFIGSLQAAMTSICATGNAWLMRYLGPKRTAMLGICIMGVCEILASFVTESVGGLFVTFGALTGFGSSLVFVVVASVPAQYFSSKRGLANGMIFAGSGFGGAALSFTMNGLIQKVGLAMAYRILAVLTVTTGLPAAWLMKERKPIARRQFIEWSLFKQTNFVLLFVASAIGNFPLYVPPFFLPLYTNSLGYRSNVGAGLVAGFTLSSAVGRIFCGFWCDRIGAINILLISIALTAISMLAIWPASQSLGPLAVFVIINGISNGGFFSTMPTVASNIFGSARVSVVMSMIITGWVGGYLMGAPIAGYILEAFGGAEGGLKAYRPAMLYAGSLAVVSGLMVLAVRLRLNKNLLAKV